MMKWIMIVVLALLAAYSWTNYSKKIEDIDVLKKQIVQIEESGQPEEVLNDMRAKVEALKGKSILDGLPLNDSPEEVMNALSTKVQGLDGEKVFSGILLTFVIAGLVGILFVVYLLPFFAQRITHAVYDSGEMVEKDIMSGARSLVAQGDYEGAIAAYQEAAAADPLNRLPWVEIAKIQKDHMHDSKAAIQTIRHALESQEWEVNDAAYFLFRLAELYDEVEGDRASAIAIMNQVVQEFPGTRHSANATHKLHEWSADGDAPLTPEEEEYLARVKSQRGE